jgi:hypothetical protein
MNSSVKPHQKLELQQERGKRDGNVDGDGDAVIDHG